MQANGSGVERRNLGGGATVERRAGAVGNLHMVSTQWATRPADERFASVDAWLANARARQAASTSSIVKLGQLRLGATDSTVGREGMLLSPGEVYVRGNRELSHFSNYSFGQACGLAGAPASYLRSLPAELAVTPLQWGLATRGAGAFDGSGEAKLYALRSATRPEGAGAGGSVGAYDPEGSYLTIGALTGAGYGRIYNADVIEGVARLVEGSGGAWGIPDARVAFPGQEAAFSDPVKATTLYESDHDMFGFLVDADHPIEIPGGSTEGTGGLSRDVLYRGFVVWNSEVGDKTFGLSTFYFRSVCANRIVWGAKDQTTLKIRHTSGGPGRFLSAAMPALRAFAESPTGGIVEAVEAARSARVPLEAGARPGDPGAAAAGAVAFLRAKGFTANAARFSVEAAEREEGDCSSVWDVAQGVTAYARGIEFADERFALERAAGALLAGVDR